MVKKIKPHQVSGLTASGVAECVACVYVSQSASGGRGLVAQRQKPVKNPDQVITKDVMMTSSISGRVPDFSK